MPPNIVRMRCFILLVFLAFPASVIAADAVPDTSASIGSQSKTNCGVTVKEALKEARQALAISDSGSERAALKCLIEAMSRFEAENPTAVRDGGIHVLTAPSSTASVR